MQDVVATCRQLVAEGASQDRIIQYLWDNNFSILDTIKTVRKVFVVSLGYAKNAVAEHPAWLQKTASNAVLHDEAVASLRDSEAGTCVEVGDLVTYEEKL